jgi:hypothetical protein
VYLPILKELEDMGVGLKKAKHHLGYNLIKILV